MTTDPLEELRKLTNVQEAEDRQLMSDAFRPRTRHPLQNWTGFVHFDGIVTREGVRQDGTTYETRVVPCFVSGLRNLKVASGFWNEDTAVIDIPVSDRKNSQIGLTTASATEVDSNVKSFADLNDREWTVEEKVKAAGKDRNGYDINIFYYSITALGPMKSSPASTAKPTEQGLAAALAAAAGRTEQEFYAEVLPYLQAEGYLKGEEGIALQSYIVKRDFIRDMLNSGRLSKTTGDKFELQPMDTAAPF